MKTCSQCNTEQQLDNFRWRNKQKGTRSPWCKSCFSKYEQEKWKSSFERRTSNIVANRNRKRRNAQFVWDYLSKNPCPCGENDPVVLEFDHRDGVSKSANVSDMLKNSYSIKRIAEEIEKCDVLCANCHRRKTAVQFGWYSNINTVP